MREPIQPHKALKFPMFMITIKRLESLFPLKLKGDSTVYCILTEFETKTKIEFMFNLITNNLINSSNKVIIL